MGHADHTSSSSTENFNQTVTPTNPTWVANGLAGIGGSLANLSLLDPYSLVPGANAQQTTAGNAALGLGGNAGLFASGADRLGQSVNYVSPEIYNGGGQAPSVLDNLSAYQDPYTESVVRSALAGYDFNAGQTAAQNRLALANDATFGGSGGAIQTALSNAQLGRDRASLQSGLLDQGYQSALGAATTDAQLRSAARDRAVQASIAQANAQLQAEQMRQAAAQGLAPSEATPTPTPAPTSPASSARAMTCAASPRPRRPPRSVFSATWRTSGIRSRSAS